MKTLFAIGDSHTFGAEILGEENYSKQNKLLSYSSKLKDELGFDKVDNWGISGASIKYTERGLIDYLSTNPKPDLVVIGWTCLGRWEICSGTDSMGNYTYEMFNSWLDPFNKKTEDELNLYKALLPIITSDDLLAEKFRTHIRCSSILKSLNIPHIFFDVMESTKFQAPISGTDKTNDKVDKYWSGSNPMDVSLYNFIDKNNYIEETTYWEHCKDKEGVSINGGHYNESAHLHWAKYLKEQLYKRNIL